MSNEIIILIAMLAVLFQSMRIVPQVVKGFRTRKVRDVSRGWIIIGTISTLLWLSYAYFISDIPIILGNMANLICYILLFYQKQVY